MKTVEEAIAEPTKEAVGGAPAPQARPTQPIATSQLLQKLVSSKVERAATNKQARTDRSAQKKAAKPNKEARIVKHSKV